MEDVNDDQIELVTDQETIPFPKHAFPDLLQEMMENFHTSLNMSHDFMGTVILFAISLAIGNTFRIKIKETWLESGVIWAILVGRTGVNKSAPVSIFCKPFEEKDKENYFKYKDELNLYSKMNSKQKKGGDKMEDSTIEEFDSFQEPIRKQFLLGDLTPEVLSKVHESNPRGVGIKSDEISFWLKTFNRYSKSSADEQNYLSIWSCKPIAVNRKSSPDILITNPFVPIIGTIQPEILHQVFSKDQAQSGFTHRFLFAYPDKIIREDFSDEEVNEVHQKNYTQLINSLSTINYDPVKDNCTVLSFDPEATQIFRTWRSMNNDRINKEENDDLCGIYSKVEIYLARIALLLQIINDKISLEESTKVKKEALLGSIELMKYYENSAIRVSQLVNRYYDPLAYYSFEKRALYKSLPIEFYTKRGEEIAINMRIPRRSFFIFLKDRNLFERQKHGFYIKRI